MDAKDSVVAITLTTLSSVNMVLHSLGSYFLIHLFKKAKKKTPQHLYIICHSISIIVQNLMAVVMIVAETYGTADLRNVHEYLGILFGAVMYCYYAFIFYITADRLAGIILHIRYPRYWNVLRAKHLPWYVQVCSLCNC